jgi:hypothetical protein
VFSYLSLSALVWLRLSIRTFFLQYGQDLSRLNPTFWEYFLRVG